MWPLFQILTATTSIILIVLTIPIAFDVGGKDAGLVFSLSLASFYFVLSILNLLTPTSSRVRASGIWLVSKSSWIVVSALLIWSLAKFSVDAPNSNWVERTFHFKRAQDLSIYEWIFGRTGLMESFALGSWYKILIWSIPVFQIGEGFCSLLVIQACGQLTRWVINNEHGDSWMIGLMSVSAGVISSAIYFLFRIASFPEIGNVDAVLIGFALACAFILGVYGISSGRGNVVESSLLFAYITLCIYQIFTDYQSNEPKTMETVSQAALPPLPPIIMASYSTFVHFASTLPSYVLNFFNFVSAAFMTITPSVLISLAYRTSVMLASARIIPAVREEGARALHDPPSLEDSDDANRFLAFLSLFSPSILVAVYTSLLMQHFESLQGEQHGNLGWWAEGAGSASNLWRWINLAFTMIIYTIELYLGRGDGENGLAHHWHNEGLNE